ncbi:MAG: sel1 repeat family protein [Thermoguttaceae bacterium]|nr:sel1 repeat family protein [Thermoguttaceae bacterium]
MRSGDKQGFFTGVKRAAENGDADARYNLGAHYANGRGVKRDLQEAARWFEKSLEAGNKEAQAALESLASLEPVQETTTIEKLVGLFRRGEEAIKTIRPRGFLEKEME